MPTQNKGGKTRVILFFAGFVLLFVLAFSLGVIIGKGVSGTRYVERESEPSMDVSAEEQGQDSERVEEHGLTETIEEPEYTQTEDPPPQKDLKLKEDKVEEGAIEVTEMEEEPEESQKPSDRMSDELDLTEKSVSSNNEKVAKTGSEEGSGDTQVATSTGSKEPGTTPAALPKTDPGGKFTVQLGSFKNRDMALQLEKKMSARGYPSFVRKVTIPEQGDWYRVRIGTFNEKSKAKTYADMLISKEQSLKNVYVTTND